eukprot:CFRG3685T1
MLVPALSQTPSLQDQSQHQHTNNSREQGHHSEHQQPSHHTQPHEQQIQEPRVQTEPNEVRSDGQLVLDAPSNDPSTSHTQNNTSDQHLALGPPQTSLTHHNPTMSVSTNLNSSIQGVHVLNVPSQQPTHTMTSQDSVQPQPIAQASSQAAEFWPERPEQMSRKYLVDLMSRHRKLYPTHQMSVTGTKEQLLKSYFRHKDRAENEMLHSSGKRDFIDNSGQRIGTKRCRTTSTSFSFTSDELLRLVHVVTDESVHQAYVTSVDHSVLSPPGTVYEFNFWAFAQAEGTILSSYNNDNYKVTIPHDLGEYQVPDAVAKLTSMAPDKFRQLSAADIIVALWRLQLQYHTFLLTIESNNDHAYAWAHTVDHPEIYYAWCRSGNVQGERTNPFLYIGLSESLVNRYTTSRTLNITADAGISVGVSGNVGHGCENQRNERLDGALVEWPYDSVNNGQFVMMEGGEGTSGLDATGNLNSASGNPLRTGPGAVSIRSAQRKVSEGKVDDTGSKKLLMELEAAKIRLEMIEMHIRIKREGGCMHTISPDDLEALKSMLQKNLRDLLNS